MPPTPPIHLDDSNSWRCELPAHVPTKCRIYPRTDAELERHYAQHADPTAEGCLHGFTDSTRCPMCSAAAHRHRAKPPKSRGRPVQGAFRRQRGIPRQNQGGRRGV